MKEYVISGYQPEKLFNYFEDISAVPRGSGNESGIADFIVKFAAERGLFCLRDDLNNVFIRKPATPGYEDQPGIMLQGHTDMVCEKNAGTEHDFLTDGLDLYVEDGWLRARGTTLGGDDGCAVAAMLYALDSDTLRHPELECLFTTGEETGLYGATGFDYSVVRSKKLINLDSEAEGVATVSCAGGIGLDFSFVPDRIPVPAFCRPLSVEISGLSGGHSGEDIIREKGKLVVAKRADRTATEGVVVTKIVGQKAYILCLACETDFVAQNSEYSASAEAMLEVAVKNDAADRDALMAAKNAEGRTVEEMVTEKSGQTGEKIELAYYGRIEAPYCAAYVHFNKKLGTILGFNKEIPAEVAHTVTMQATAMAPVSISEADCPAEVVEHERKIAVEAMKQDPKNANKPEAILEKIAEGKMRKFFEENTLLAQPVVGEKESIADYIHKADKDATVVAYKRFALGE